MFHTETHCLVFDRTVHLHVGGRGRPAKSTTTTTTTTTPTTPENNEEPIVFNSVTPFNHTDLEYPFPK
jgi:hypothetical protein